MNKKDLLLKLVNVPSKAPPSFWAKEYRILNSLLKKFPNMRFWEKIEVQKVSSLTLYAGEDVCEIHQKYKNFNFKPPIKNVNHKLGKKSGKDFTLQKKIKTIKQFIDEEEN